jgi:DNA-binding PadR family transcriptional regulator
MSQTDDKRRRADLDLFVLALIDNGVSTPYELQSKAGLSPGATIPALQRLLEARNVRRGKQGARRRLDYKITAAGKKLLKTGWKSLLEAGPTGDLDADLRIALLVLWGRGKRRTAADFLLQSASGRIRTIEARTDNAVSENTEPLAKAYRSLRAAAATILLKAEAAATAAVAKDLPKYLRQKQARRGQARNSNASRGVPKG